MHGGLDHLRITSTDQFFALLVSRLLVPQLHQQLVRRVKQGGGQRTHVVLNRLPIIRGLVSIAVAHHLAQDLQLICQESEPVVVTVDGLFEAGEHEGAP